MNTKQRLAHWLVGHVPYYIYDYKYDGGQTEKRYRCALCQKELTGGVYHWLYDVETNKREV